MKIAYLSFNLFPSHYAHTVQILKMCQAFTNSGHELTLFAQQSKEYKSEQQVFEIYSIKNTFQIIWGRFSTRKYPMLLQIFKLLVKNKKHYDLFFIRNYNYTILTFLLRLNFIYECHSLPLSKLGKLFFPILIKYSKYKIVTISAELAKILAEKYKVKESRFIVAHDAFDLSENDNYLKHPLRLPKVKAIQKKIMYVGSFYKGRGLELVIELAANFKEHQFICVGGKKEEIEKLETTSIPNNVSLFERIDHKFINSLLSDSDILLMPYSKVVTIEGINNTANFCSPMKIGEYLNAGKPILVSNLPSLSEIFINQYNALVCIPDDIESWKLQLHKLLSSENLAKQISNNAIVYSKNFTWENRVKIILGY